MKDEKHNKKDKREGRRERKWKNDRKIMECEIIKIVK